MRCSGDPYGEGCNVETERGFDYVRFAMAWAEVHEADKAMVWVEVPDEEVDGLLEAVSAFIGRSSSFSEQIGEVGASDLEQHLEDFANSRNLRNLMDDDPSPPGRSPILDKQVMVPASGESFV